MIKQIMILLALTLSTTIFAKQVKFKISTSYKNGITTKTDEIEFIANMNQEFQFPGKNNDSPFIYKLTFSEFGNKIDQKESLMIKGNISTQEDDKVKTIATPKVITLVGREATISIEEEDGTIFEMKVLPVKTSEKL